MQFIVKCKAILNYYGKGLLCRQAEYNVFLFHFCIFNDSVFLLNIQKISRISEQGKADYIDFRNIGFSTSDLTLTLTGFFSWHVFFLSHDTHKLSL